ncbi:MAG: hypothetical protein JWQ38_3421 [Flavipsychrobacter sp.]|nr:hypothetical protein [Flavipsychrobacter sp.]
MKALNNQKPICNKIKHTINQDSLPNLTSITDLREYLRFFARV